MKLGDLYDARNSAPLVKTDLDVFTSGAIDLVEEAHRTKFGECPALTIKLDAESAALYEEGDTHAVLLMSSKQLREVVAKRAAAAGRKSIVGGDWIKVGVVGHRETASGRPMNVWAVPEYEAGDGVDTEAWG